MSGPAMRATVEELAAAARQPLGGYLRPTSFSREALELPPELCELADGENVPDEACRSAVLKLIHRVAGGAGAPNLSDRAVRDAALEAARAAGPTCPRANPASCESIRKMCLRALRAREALGGLTARGAQLPGAGTVSVGCAAAWEVWGDDLVRLDCKRGPLSKEETLELAMIWRMGLAAGIPAFDKVRSLAALNARGAMLRRIPCARVPARTRAAIERDVIGYVQGGGA